MVVEANRYWPSAAPDPLGPLLGADDVRDATRAVIETWSPYYLSIVSQRLLAAGKLGEGSPYPNPLRDFEYWTLEPSNRAGGTGSSPVFLVTVPNTIGKPRLRGNGTYISVWRSQVLVDVYGKTWEAAADLVSFYEKAVRLSVLQHRSLGGLAMSTSWQGTQLRASEHAGTRVEAQAILAFDVQVDGSASILGAPAAPLAPAQPPPADPTVETTVVQVSNGDPPSEENQ
jgi:hypothetical protein